MSLLLWQTGSFREWVVFLSKNSGKGLGINYQDLVQIVSQVFKQEFWKGL